MLNWVKSVFPVRNLYFRKQAKKFIAWIKFFWKLFDVDKLISHYPCKIV